MEWQLMTAEQKDITGLVRKFLENELAPLVQECDGVSRFPMEVFKKMGEIGLWGMDIPAEYGGPGFDLQTLSLLREEPLLDLSRCLQAEAKSRSGLWQKDC